MRESGFAHSPYFMRIRLLRQIGELEAGIIIYRAASLAREWIKNGWAMEDKSIEPKEYKDG